MPTKRINGLDSIRFICAFWVLLSHYGLPPLPETVTKDSLWGLAIRGVYHNFFCGQAAVIVFFVISGFCIHFPFRDTPRIPLLAFWAQRFFRIGLPLIMAVPLAIRWNAGALLAPANSFAFTPEGIKMHTGEGVVWSLICELVYYAAYPIIFFIRRRTGWVPLIAVVATAAAGLLIAFPEAKDFPALGNGVTWVIGLPSWLAGCVLAEIFDAKPRREKPAVKKVWMWRLLLLGASIAASAIRFHAPFGLQYNGLGWSLNLFAWLCLPWLKLEIEHLRLNPPPALLESIGSGSYSIYLFHVIGIAVLSRLFEPSRFSLLWWAIGLLMILTGSAIFYLIIERPSHWIARAAGKHLRNITTTSH